MSDLVIIFTFFFTQMEQVSFIWIFNLFREFRVPPPLSSPPSLSPLPRGTLKVQCLESSATCPTVTHPLTPLH